jgi:hypothetical protein
MRKLIKPFLYLITASILAGVIFSCSKEDEFITTPDAKLLFSTDTVLFDTVFTTLGSTTKRFKVYNRNDKSIKTSIRLAGGSASPYRINVDGEAVTGTSQFTILPKDSLYVFVDVTIDPNNKNQPFIQKDSIVFITNGNVQDVKLIAWGQDAFYLKNIWIPYYDHDTVWTNDKPIVIFDSIAINPNSKLIIEAGTRIFSNNNSYIWVAGSLIVNGTVENPVIFSGIRTDEYYKNIPGQWGGIRFFRFSKDNSIKNCQIRNATIGIQVDSLSVNTQPKLLLENVRIENMSAVGLYGLTADITAYNLLIDNCCRLLAVGLYGGKYRFYHSTFAHLNFNCSSFEPGLFFDNADVNYGTFKLNHDLEITLVNSIVWGSQDDEFGISNIGKGIITLIANNTLFKTTNKDLNKFDNILNRDPLFVLPNKYNFGLDTLSPAINKGIKLTFPEVESDLNGISRNNYGNPDLGAFERKQ